jgi:hypothetical protein
MELQRLRAMVSELPDLCKYGILYAQEWVMNEYENIAEELQAREEELEECMQTEQEYYAEADKS